MTTTLHQAQARRRRVRWIVLVVVVVVLVVAGALTWRWYDAPAQRADRIAFDIGKLHAVDEAQVEDGVLEVDMHHLSEQDEVQEVYDEAARWIDAREEAGSPSYVAVHVGATLVRVGPDYERVDPELPVTVAAWEPPPGVQVEITADGGVATLAATATDTPSVTTMAWLLDHDLGAYQTALVGEVSATNELSRTTSRVRGEPGESVSGSAAIFSGLADLADLDPAVDVDPAGAGTLTVTTSSGELDEARRRVAETLDRFPLQSIQAEVVAA